MGTAVILVAHQADAASQIWDGSSSGNWTTGANWVGNAAPGSTTTANADVATFPGTGVSNFSVNLGGSNRFIGGITFDSSTSYNLYIYDTNLSTRRTLTVNNITVSSGNHAITGAKLGSGNAGDLKLLSGTYSVASGSTLTLDARIHTTDAAPAYNKTGGGTLVLNAHNGAGSAWNFSTGLFTVSEGTLKLAVNGAAGHSENKYTVSNGATIEVAALGGYGASNGTLTLRGTGVGGVGALYVSATTSITSGTGTGVVLAANSRIGVAADQTLTLSMPVSGGFALEKSGAGTLTLSGSNSYTGATEVSQGVLALGAANRISNSSAVSITGGTFDLGGFTETVAGVTMSSGTIANGTLTGSSYAFTNSGTVSANLAGSGVGLIKSGTGTLELSGENTYTGTTQIDAGTLKLSGIAPSLGTGNVTVGANGTFGGTGTVNGDVTFAAGADFYFNSYEDAGLTIADGKNVTFGGFSIENLIGVDWDTVDLNTPITLIQGTVDFDNSTIGNMSLATAHPVGTGNRKAYFTGGSLNLVVIPEPATFGIVLSVLAAAIIRRRRFG